MSDKDKQEETSMFQHKQQLPAQDPAAVAAAEMARQRIQSAYMLALHNPRLRYE